VESEERDVSEPSEIVAFLSGAADDETAERLALRGMQANSDVAQVVAWINSRSDVVWRATTPSLANEPPPAVAATVDATSSLILPRSLVTDRWTLRWRASIAVAAASVLLVALVGYALRPIPATRIELAAIWPQIDSSRGDGGISKPTVRADGAVTVPSTDFAVVLESPRDGVATLVLTTETRTLVFPQLGQEPIEIKAGVKRSYGPLPGPESRMLAIVVVTARRADDELRNVVAEWGGATVTKDSFMDRIRERLVGDGHVWLAVARVELEPVRTSDDQK